MYIDLQMDLWGHLQSPLIVSGMRQGAFVGRAVGNKSVSDRLIVDHSMLCVSSYICKSRASLAVLLTICGGQCTESA